MRACCYSRTLGSEPLWLFDTLPLPPWEPPPSKRTPAEQGAWSSFVSSIMAADEAAWDQATAAAKEAAPAAGGILESLRQNKTAVYVTAGGLFLLALMRRSH
jgi:hypothetical protein